MGYPQAIIAEDAMPSSGLGCAVTWRVAPGGDRSFVPEHRKREKLSGRAEAFEPFDRNEAVEAGQFVLQGGRKIEVGSFIPSAGQTSNRTAIMA